jgi:hypothetical protein
MGFFKDIRKVNKMGEEAPQMGRSQQDVPAQLQQAQASMGLAQQFMAQQTAAAQIMVCTPGREVKVAIDPVDRTKVWIDWAASPS